MFPLVILFGAIGSNPTKIIFILSIPIVLFLTLRFEFLYLLIIILLFIKEYLFGFSWVSYLPVVLLLSFIITFKNISINDFRSSIVAPLLIYFILTIPSYINNQVPWESIKETFNLFIFFILVLLTIAAHSDQVQFKKYLVFYLGMVLINGVFLILNGVISGSREFGFAGVMYVDYVGIGIILSIIILLFASSQNKIFYTLLTLILIVASLFTQTRNAFISIILTFTLLLLYLIKKSDYFNLNKRYLIIILLSSIFLVGGIYISLKTINPEISQRTEELAQSNQQILDEEGAATSSIISRIFIWSTAVNAFSHNPIFGVGIYAFPYISEKYNKLPQFIFEEYVEGRYPHIAFLAVLTETGIVGLIGFIILLFYIIRLSFESMSYSSNRNEKITTLLLNWAQVYIVISMFMTDAWLWDHGIILWGIVLGLNISNRKLLKSKMS